MMIKISRFVYLAGVWLFLLGVVVQVFMAGMVVVARQTSWNAHINLGHILAGPLLLMLISMYLGRMPRSTKQLTWLLVLIYVLQADVLIFLRVQAPMLSALHPVLALGDFSLGLALALRAWAITKTVTALQATQPSLKSSSET